MPVSDHIEEFAGKPVRDWKPGVEFENPQGTLPRIGLSYDDYDKNRKWADTFAAFVQHPDALVATGLVLGAWDYDFSGADSSEVVEALIAASGSLPNVRAIFFGDIIGEESEISWIRQSDITPLLAAYPLLEHFVVRGGDGLQLEPFSHNSLRSLTIQAGGLDGAIVRAVAASKLENLEHLELWLGTPEYGGTVTAQDVEPILQGHNFSKLNYLGLRNAEHADDMARAVGGAPILERIQVLDLSMGILTDEGAHALLASSKLAKLHKLDLHHHFLSPEMMERLRALPLEVNLDDVQKPDDYDGEIYRFVAVSE